MPAVADVAAFLERFAPARLAAEWDNVGLLIGDRQADAARVMTCLTVTPESAGEALDERANLIVTHHPFPFRPTKRITSDTVEGRMLLDLLTVKTIIGFASRPLAWFILPAIPAALISVGCIGVSFYEAPLLEQPFRTPLAGVGVLLGALALFLALTGMLGELVQKVGEHRSDRLSMLTAQKL